MITIITVGKKHEYKDAIEAYQKRLKKPFDIKWVILESSPKNPTEAVLDESERISKATSTPTDAFTILLDEHGKNLTSPELSHLLSEKFQTRSATFIIGGAYGVSEALKQKADFIWSLSSLTLPHQLVRLILTEQLYRAQSIAVNHPYHHA